MYVESTHQGVNQCLKYVTQLQQQRPESPERMYLWWSLCTLYLNACQVRVTVGDAGLLYSGYVF